MCGQEVYFEPDEERNYRIIIEQQKIDEQITQEILKAITETIEDILKLPEEIERTKQGSNMIESWLDGMNQKQIRCCFLFKLNVS
ncbi:MAG: hypothetical protein EOP48_26665, partial [Sphingobacteriales bacterium]